MAQPSEVTPKHSPAPWKIDGNFDAAVAIAIIDADGNEIFGLEPMEGEDLDEWGECSTANAHLIAAAPDLLLQLKALVVQIEHSPHLIIPPNVRAAIAKAEGRL